MFIHYEESILSSISAIRQYLGLETSLAGENRLNNLLSAKKPNKIIFLLIDGMGANLIEKKLTKYSFLREHFFYKTQTVFPSTTTAALTSIQNGKAPNENAWLGWIQYFKELDDEIIPFLGKSYYSNKKYSQNLVYELLPVDNIVDELNNHGKTSYSLYPAFKKNGCKSFAEMCSRLAEDNIYKNYDFVFAYWDKLDSLMHEVGPGQYIVDEMFNEIDDQIANMAQKLSSDTLLIITADHGQVDIKRNYNLFTSNYKKYLRQKPCLENRAMALYIYKDKQAEFAKIFKNEFEEDYILLTKEEVLKTKLFGPHHNHPRFEEFIGDFIAIAKSDLNLYYDENDIYKPKLGDHAGILDDEIMVPLITYMRN